MRKVSQKHNGLQNIGTEKKKKKKNGKTKQNKTKQNPNVHDINGDKKACYIKQDKVK